VVAGLGANPAQPSLTLGFNAIYPGTINPADKVLAVDNSTMWAMNNAGVWLDITTDNIGLATAAEPGLALHSTLDGAIGYYVAGVGQVNGWSALKQAVADNAANIATIQAAITIINTTLAGKQDKFNYDVDDVIRGNGTKLKMRANRINNPNSLVQALFGERATALTFIYGETQSYNGQWCTAGDFATQMADELAFVNKYTQRPGVVTSGFNPNRRGHRVTSDLNIATNTISYTRACEEADIGAIYVFDSFNNATSVTLSRRYYGPTNYNLSCTNMLVAVLVGVQSNGTGEFGQLYYGPM